MKEFIRRFGLGNFSESSVNLRSSSPRAGCRSVKARQEQGNTSQIPGAAWTHLLALHALVLRVLAEIPRQETLGLA